MGFWNINKKDDLYEDDNFENEDLEIDDFDQPREKSAPVAHGTLQMKVVRPKKLKEATEIAESLQNGQTIVLNLDEMDDSAARRMIDYIAGVIFAIRGKIERPADRTFLLTPDGISVATEEKDSAQ